MTLIKAFENTEYSLKIIGASSSGYDETLKSYLKNKKHNIEFLGSKKFEEIQVYLGKCAFTVMPTEIYDNFPNTVLESYAFKKCVLATDTGSLREIITDNETGILFPVKDFKFLKDKIQYLFSNRSKCIELGEKAFGKLNEDFSAEKHYRDLIGLFETTIAGHTMSKTPLN
jgi:glycosyltransferase involved in cell wall biosynthesis